MVLPKRTEVREHVVLSQLYTSPLEFLKSRQESFGEWLVILGNMAENVADLMHAGSLIETNYSNGQWPPIGPHYTESFTRPTKSSFLRHHASDLTFGSRNALTNKCRKCRLLLHHRILVPFSGPKKCVFGSEYKGIIFLKILLGHGLIISRGRLRRRRIHVEA